MKHFVLIVIFFVTLRVSAQTLESDRLALVALYNATGGPNWINKTGWTVPGTAGDNPCSWYGVTCNGAGRVEALNLPNNDLRDELPAEIGNLSELKSLKLPGADYGPLGLEVGPYAEYRLTGSIPTQIGNLLKLEYLDLSRNEFSGSIPSTIGNLVNLKQLDIHYQPFDDGFDSNARGGVEGIIPVEIGSLVNLEYLDLSVQKLTGDIPVELGNLTELKTLNLSRNYLTGEIPPVLGMMPKLNYMDLSTWVGYEEPCYSVDCYSVFGKLRGPVPDLSGMPATAKVYLNNQSFTFEGMENNISRLRGYVRQEKIKLHMLVVPSDVSGMGTGYVEAGGDISKNTYKWYKDDILVHTETGDNYFEYTEEGLYYVEITNSAIPGLTLVSEKENIRSMPVKLVSFNGKSVVDQNILSWKTTSETENAGFQVERSDNAVNFEKIGFVDGNGDSNEQKQYSFTDDRPLATSYYRLKQIDHSGKFEYSTTISVKNTAFDLAIYPNPASDHIFVENPGVGNEILIKDLNGKVLINCRIPTGKAIDIRSLKNGIYLFTVGDVTRKLVVKK